MRPAWCGLTHGRPNPVVCGRKFCTGCGRWRHAADFALKRSGRLDSYCGACRRQQYRHRYRRMTPEQRARRHESERFYRDRLRREQGTIDTYRPRGSSVVDRHEFVFLDPGPLLGAIKGWEDLTLEKVTGIPARTIYRYRVGESHHVRLDIADKLALAVGTHLWDLYGDAPLIHIHDAEMAA